MRCLAILPPSCCMLAPSTPILIEPHLLQLAPSTSPPRRALWQLLDAVPSAQRQRVASLAIDGTSATTMLIDAASGRCLAPPKMYNEAQSAAAVARAKQLAPEGHTATAATSTLCKVLEWDAEGAWQAAAEQGLDPAFVHQAGKRGGELGGWDVVCVVDHIVAVGAPCRFGLLACAPDQHVCSSR